jgi:type I restriction enzyme S subunit
VITHPFRSILGPIPDSWDVISLKETLARSATGDWGDDRGEVSFPVIRSTNFTNDLRLDCADVEERSFPLDRASRFDIREGDFLLERSGGGPGQPVGRVARIEADLPDYGYGNFLQLLRINDEVMVPDFVGWCLFELHRSGVIERLQHQTTQMRNLDFRDYLTIRLPRPSLETQEELARRLLATHASKPRIGEEIRAATRLRDSLVSELLSVGLPASRREQRPTALGVLPASWDGVRLSAIADIAAGVTLNADRAPRSRPYRYLTVVNVQRDAITLGEPRYLELSDSEIPRKLLRAGDILVVEGHANRSEIGRAALVREETAGLTYQNHLFRVRVSDPGVDPRFLILALNRPDAQRHWAAVSNTSSGLNTINRRQLRRLLIPKPSLDEQRAIVTKVDAADRVVANLQRQYAATSDLHCALLTHILTGRVQAVDTVPA